MNLKIEKIEKNIQKKATRSKIYHILGIFLETTLTMYGCISKYFKTNIAILLMNNNCGKKHTGIEYRQ